MTESELIRKAKEGDDLALETLVKQFSPLLKKRSKLKSGGADEQDFFQVALLAFIKAIKSFDEERSVAFGSYASMVVQSAITDFLRSLNREKNLPLNEAEPIENAAKKEENDDPVKKYLETEASEELSALLRSSLSKNQYNIVILRRDGFSYAQIAEKLGLTSKQVDNALCAVKKKLKIILNRNSNGNI